MSIRNGIILIALLLGLGIQPAVPTQAASRCFSETNQCIDGRIREFWEQNGGLAVFGLPIGGIEHVLIEGKQVDIQRFERNRLELHPENARPYDVLLGRLGVQYLQRTYNTENLPSKGIAEKDIGGNYLAYRDDCHWFVEVQHYACSEFYEYWHTHGLQLDNNHSSFTEAESMALFGMPISSFQTQTIDGHEFFVQIFERARFEYHPENIDPYKVQLGLLGREEAPIATEITPTTTTTSDSTNANAQPILPESDLAAFRYKMPAPGYWMASNGGIVASAGSFQYFRVLKGYTAPKGYKYVVFAITIKNNQSADSYSRYVNSAYFTITDLEGGTHTTDVLTYHLEGLFTDASLRPGEQTGGQIAFLIPSNSAPAQIHVDFTYTPITIELRTWPITN